MPIYEYQCSACEHRLEALQKISDPALTECPVCHRPALKKLVSAASFRLKGGGWYETDFKTEGKRKLAESDSAGGGDKAATDKAGAEAKPASSNKASTKQDSSANKPTGQS